jgi:hypothetical protein
MSAFKLDLLSLQVMSKKAPSQNQMLPKAIGIFFAESW